MPRFHGRVLTRFAMVRHFLLPAAATALLTGGHGRAAIVFSDSFTRADGSLVGTSPEIGGAWVQTGATTTNPISLTGGLVALTTTGQDVYAPLGSPVANTGGSSLYAAVDLRLTAAQATGDYFLHFSDPVATTSNFYGRLGARSSGAGYQLTITSNSGTGFVTTPGTTVLDFNTTYRVVVAWNFVAGAANDTFDVYVNPADPVPANNTAYIGGYAWTGNAEPAAQVSAVNFRQGSGTAAPTLTMDNLVVSTTFAEIVPEPSSAVLVLAGALAFARRRR